MSTKTKKTVFITGASSGIGRQLAFKYAQNNHQVFLTARRKDLLKNIADQVNRDQGKKSAAYKAFDIKDTEALKKCSEEALEIFGKIDLLICNAGMGMSISVKNFSTQKIKELYDVNVFGALQTIEAFLPYMMKRKKGHIVAISSLAAYTSFAKTHPYCATKAALKSHIDGLAKELKNHNILLSCICPGFIKTEMTSANKHPMPFLMELEDATHRIYMAIKKNKPTYNFPWQSYYSLKFLQLLPQSIRAYLKL